MIIIIRTIKQKEIPKPATNSDPTLNGQKALNSKHKGYPKIVSDKKKHPLKKEGKTHTIIITYVQITEEEAKVKRAIIEAIFRKHKFSKI